MLHYSYHSVFLFRVAHASKQNIQRNDDIYCGKVMENGVKFQVTGTAQKLLKSYLKSEHNSLILNQNFLKKIHQILP